MKVLISAFEKFGNHLDNSSEIIVNLLRERRSDVSTLILPVSFKDSWKILKDKIDHERPDYVISLGLAGSRQVISLEKVAINWIDCEISDNSGLFIKNSKIKHDGPTAYFSSLPLEKFKELKTTFPTEISLSAGAFLCNYIMYELLHDSEKMNYHAGFIHLPHLGENQELIYQSLCLMIDSLLLEPETI